ncbi:chondroitinase family polysaccharide lyase [uncultured Draconibacterium sp.]|uniref:chondroitinase family polysaccharide lyase n=1 Tax=uncultured Draconibacterium sp. TaxID=1573823 RepID=UPI0025F1A92E|nr:chondroitinase family polysaccharide lyase [uncultured Draconibacterium sp.]
MNGLAKLLMIFGFLCTNIVFAQHQAEKFNPYTKISFENGIPDNILASKGKISLSEKHRTSGTYSLRWDFCPHDTLTVYGDIAYEKTKVKNVVEVLGEKYTEMGHHTCFRFPIYSEKEQDVRLRFAFGKNDSINCYTDVMLNYKHWYRFSMAYDKGHLRGEPREDMNCFRIIVKSEKSGTIFLDDLVLAVKQRWNNLYPTLLELWQTYPQDRTTQVYPDHLLNEPHFPLSELTQNHIQSFQTIEDRLFEVEWGGKKQVERIDDSVIANLEVRYKSFNIVRTDSGITGNHGTASYAFVGLLKEIALNYARVQNQKQKDKLGLMAINMIENAIDENDREMSHYRGKGFADACYLAKDCLKKHGLLDETISFIKQNYEFKRFYNEDNIYKGINSDYLYTSSTSALLCVLLMDNSPEKVRDMQHLVSFFSNVALNYAKGLSDTFKPDGSHYHHYTAYPTRYANYTMPEVCKFVYFLSQTDFRITEDAHERMKHNAQVRSFYKSQRYFPWAFAHNNIVPELKAEVEELLYLALAGSPDGKQKLDEEMAGLYLYHKENEQLPELAQVLVDKNIAQAPIHQGHKTLSYFAKGLHRKNDWLITVGAYSKYVYQIEMWSGRPDGRGNVNTNQFVNWGQTEIIFPDKKGLNAVNNGWSIDGWDWTRFPGTTTIKAPLERIKTTPVNGIEQLYSDEGFVGGLDFSDGNGVFVSKIHGSKKYKLESFYATKTYFFFNDLMVCLGSGISNNLPQYETQTTLFQNSISEKFKLHVNDTESCKNSYFEKELDNNSNWLLDSRNIGYYLPKGQNLKVSYNLQKSRNSSDTEDTSGKFETAWLKHGFAPEEKQYEYAVKVQTTASDMELFAQKMNSETDKVYHVIQADKNVHIVEFPEAKTKAYVLFRKNFNLNSGVLKGVSFPSLIMTKEHGDKLSIAVSDPDLFHNGTESKPTIVKVILNGKWHLEELVSRKASIVSQEDSRTVINFECQHGLTSEVLLKKIK